MDRLTREMTFEEEYVILQKEAKELFDKENKESEPPESNCVVRRALRCIKKLVAELETYKKYNLPYAESQYNKALDDVLKLPKYTIYDSSNEFINIAISIEDILKLKETINDK